MKSEFRIERPELERFCAEARELCSNICLSLSNFPLRHHLPDGDRISGIRGEPPHGRRGTAG
jgi:hypothetical protein